MPPLVLNACLNLCCPRTPCCTQSLPQHVTEKDLQQRFSDCGHVDSVMRLSPGAALVRFADTAAVPRAVRSLNGALWQGSTMRVDACAEQQGEAAAAAAER